MNVTVLSVCCGVYPTVYVEVYNAIRFPVFHPPVLITYTESSLLLRFNDFLFLIFINVGAEKDKEKEKDKDKDGENNLLNLTVENLMAINISKNIIDIVHRYTSSTSAFTSTFATYYQSITCVLFCEKGFCQMINARYEMLDSSYPVLSPEEVSVREQLTSYVRSHTRRIP